MPSQRNREVKINQKKGKKKKSTERFVPFLSIVIGVIFIVVVREIITYFSKKSTETHVETNLEEEPESRDPLEENTDTENDTNPDVFSHQIDQIKEKAYPKEKGRLIIEYLARATSRKEFPLDLVKLIGEYTVFDLLNHARYKCVEARNKYEKEYKKQNIEKEKGELKQSEESQNVRKARKNLQRMNRLYEDIFLEKEGKNPNVNRWPAFKNFVQAKIEYDRAEDMYDKELENPTDNSEEVEKYFTIVEGIYNEKKKALRSKYNHYIRKEYYIDPNKISEKYKRHLTNFKLLSKDYL